MKKIIAIVMMVLLLIGCTPQASSSKKDELEETTPETGILTLKINPEVQIEYDTEGLVLSLTGINEEGKTITAAYTDYIGKDVYVVLKQLIEIIHEEGFLKENEKAEHKDITLELEPGSVLPTDNFFGQASKEINDILAELTQKNIPEHKISLDQAKTLAKQLSKNNEEDILSVKERFNEKDNLYHFEFLTDSLIEILQIDARTGRSLKHHVEALERKRVSSNDSDNTENSPKTNAIEKVPVKMEQKTQRNQESNVETKNKSDIVETKKEETASEPKQKQTPKPQAKQETQSESKNESKTNKPEKEKPKIMTLNEAKAIALKHAGLSGQSVAYDDAELDYDEGVPVYEIEFDHGGFEYEFEIQAITGKILDYEKDD